MQSPGTPSEVAVFLQPLHLGLYIPEYNITLFVLETPWNDDQEVSFTDPDAFFDLALDPAHACDAIITAHTNVVCAEHQIRGSKNLIFLFAGEPHPDDLCWGS